MNQLSDLLNRLVCLQTSDKTLSATVLTREW